MISFLGLSVLSFLSVRYSTKRDNRYLYLFIICLAPIGEPHYAIFFEKEVSLQFLFPFAEGKVEYSDELSYIGGVLFLVTLLTIPPSKTANLIVRKILRIKVADFG